MVFPSQPSRRGCLSALALTALAWCLCAAGAGCGQPAPPVRVRVMTYNIHHGQGEDGTFDLERLAKVIRDAQPDLVALQEVDCRTRRAGGVDQAAELGRLTGMHAVFGKAMDFSGGQYGEAVLSRWPILESTAHQLGHDRGTEPRAALAVRVRAGKAGPVLLFVGTHLDHRRDGALRLRQAKKLNELFVNDAGHPVILTGDLNAMPDSDAMRALLHQWTPAAGKQAAPTWPADKPTDRIDYILLRPAAGWRIVEFTVIDEKIASDHRPLLAVLEWHGQGVDAASCRVAVTPSNLASADPSKRQDAASTVAVRDVRHGW